MTSKVSGRFQVYYERIHEELEKIKEENNYRNLSKAFAHWYMSNFENVSEIDLGEIIVDGDGDNGIDAAIIHNNQIDLYQFKFPDKVDNIIKQINETTALKLLNGYKKLTASRKPRKGNDVFFSFRERVKKENIFKYNLKFVCYTDKLSINAVDALETEIETIKSSTGNNISYGYDDKKNICDKFDRKQRKNSIDIELKYGQLYQSYNKGTEVKSWTGFARAIDILNSSEEHMDIIFDENIRNYEGDNNVNQGMIKTSTDDKESKNFYFYHNGIVYITDSCEPSTGNQVVSMSSAAIVNGCQTVVSLRNAKESGQLKEDVFLPIRIIQTSDIDLRGQITEYLNSQTKIRDSYFLSNNAFIRQLQTDLLTKGYFLERLANEYSYKRSLDKVADFPKDKILPLEKTVQIYVAYYVNSSAAIAKRGKNELFNRDTIDELISSINAEKVIKSFTTYNGISKIITKYRKCKRTDRNDEFLESLGYTSLSEEQYAETMDKYIFMNTADLLLLNTFSNIEVVMEFEPKTILAISLCREVLDDNPKMSPSGATKNTSIFEQVQTKAKNYSII